ncbi:hypothetical protein F4808DRAFT_463980 [Astrocystis sublimbata]|nr:hypothetical protein F4808DRAFT_465360 [Astrocystis sublimbata]KAI0196480.1 hypothetical protein F4808DRAFT_463980 [Astrocystis sublimbata]
MSFAWNDYLSGVADVAGILTFIFALVATFFVQSKHLQNSQKEYDQVRTSLTWFKTESCWFSRLEDAVGDSPETGRQDPNQTESKISTFVLGRVMELEDGLKEVVETVEGKIQAAERGRWVWAPKTWRTSVAFSVAWWQLRAKALSLMRQRETLTARACFVQTNLLATRLREVEQLEKLEQDKIETGLQTMEATLQHHKADLYQWGDLLYRTTLKSQASRHERHSPTTPPDAWDTRGRRGRCREVRTDSDEPTPSPSPSP